MSASSTEKGGHVMPSPDTTTTELDRDTMPGARECLLCYVYRMLAFGCDTTLHWAQQWRGARAPRLRGLDAWLHAHGAYCDCELFMNGWQPRDLLSDEHGDWEYPDEMPPCRGVRGGSSQPCDLWASQSRYPRYGPL
jgi:hypothetical protein